MPAGMGKVLENCLDATTDPLSSLSSCLPPTSTERPSSLTWTLSSSGAKPSAATEASSTDSTTSVDALSCFSALTSTDSAFFSSSTCLAFLGATILRVPSFWFSLEWMASTLQSGGSESDLSTRREETTSPLASFSSRAAFSLSIPSDTLISMSSGEKTSTGTENSTEPSSLTVAFLSLSDAAGENAAEGMSNLHAIMGGGLEAQKSRCGDVKKSIALKLFFLECIFSIDA